MAGKVKNIHEGHRKRLRNRFAENGLNGFHPHEILELILFYSIPRANTNEIAHNLINRFGSVYHVFNASPEELSSVKGMGSKSIEFIKIFGDVCSYYLEHENFGEKPSDVNAYATSTFFAADRFATYRTDCCNNIFNSIWGSVCGAYGFGYDYKKQLYFYFRSFQLS